MHIESHSVSAIIVPVPIPYPEVALDVDEPADYRLVSEILSHRSAP